ncbi:MAG: DUF262 domain-containing protein [Victivallaceae bacterium]|nr:DUF262 domain-containing protein [Victivallaceae bacterium]
MDNLPNTFLALLEKYNVEIPMIQRDYAQGRGDEKTGEIREHFIKEMLSHIKNKETLELDFIYGPIKNKTFIPVDGQQRLTTLFLLHWYLAKKAGSLNDRIKDLNNRIKDLKKFTYKVRTSTQDFLDALLAESKGGKLELTNSPKAEILDASWYYSMWNYDPSIQGMLNTLDTMHGQYAKNYKSDNLWKNLSENNPTPIQFNLLNMADYNLSDELYLKMNARGLALSDFENFKAWLQGYCDERKHNDNEYFNDLEASDKLCLHWTHKIDKEWTDLFWKLSDGDSDKFDKMFMNFFNGMAQIAIINNPIKQPEDNSIAEDEDKLKKIEQFHNAINNNSYIPFNDYDRCFTQESLVEFFTLLDALCDNENLLNLVIDFNGEGEKIIQRFVNNHSYDDIVKFYAVFKYVTNEKLKVFDNDETLHPDFKHWIRVIRNLVENTTISNANIIEAIESINTLLKGCESKNILQNLKDNENMDIKPFTKAQVQEERLKAELILSDKNDSQMQNWEKEIIKAENHPLFRGQIGFLLKKFREGNDKEFTDLGAEDLGVFKKRVNIAYELWDKDGSINKYKKEYLIIRSILVYCDQVNLGIGLNNDADNWRALLKRNDIQVGLINLFNTINNKELMFDYFIKLCADYKERKPLWRYYVIKHGNILLKQVENKKIYKHESEVYLYNKETWRNNNNQIILSNYRNKIIFNFLKENEKFTAQLHGTWWIINAEDDLSFYRGYQIIVSHSSNMIRVLFQPQKIQIEKKEKDEWIVPDVPDVLCEKFKYPDNEKDILDFIENIKKVVQLTLSR